VGTLLTFPHAKTTAVKSCSFSDVQAAIKAASPGDVLSLPSGSTSWSSSLVINKQNLTLRGNGIGATIISCGSKSISLTGETANNLHISGIEFHSGSQLIFVSGTGTPRQGIKNLRVDHCKFVGTNVAIETNGAATGVFDHCVFENTYGARLYGSNDATARPPFKLGTSDALFFEDNTINVTASGNPPHFIASNSFSKYVIRHNTFNYKKSLWDIVDAHGACEVKGRGSATWEIYENNFSIIASMNRIIHLRGGQGVVFNNVFQGYTPTKPVTITDYAACNGPCTQSCTTYPCPDLINHAYFWNNKIGTKLVDPVNVCTKMLSLNRDYFFGQMPNYTPYTYPHPLTSVMDSGAVSVEKATAAQQLINSGFSIHHNNLNGSTRFVYRLGEGTHVKMSVYTIDGNLVSTLADENNQPGEHEVTWNGANIPSGMYILRAVIGGIEKSYSFSR
jgi:hypothetical protein